MNNTGPNLPSLPRRSKAMPLGLTFLELLLSLTVTVLVGLAIFAMLSAVSYGTSSSQDVRSLVTEQMVINNRMVQALHDSHMVLAYGTNYLVLWEGDSDTDDLPDLSELRFIDLDNSGNLWSYKGTFPNTWTQSQIDAADTSYSLSSNFYNVVTGLEGNQYFPATLWMPSVSSATFTINTTNVQTATLVSYRMTLTSGSQSTTAIGAGSPRN